MICQWRGTFERFQNGGSEGKNVHCLQPRNKVSRKPCLNLCSFKRLKQRCSIVRYLTPSGSLTLNIDLLLGYIKEGSLFLKTVTVTDSEFCISGASSDDSDKEFGKKIWNNQFCNWKSFLFFACVIEAFTRWYNIKKVLRAFSWR